jgi:hypothetical protein
MANGTPVMIAGKRYLLRYLLTDRQAIEARCDGKPILEVMQSGRIEYQAVVVWAGLHHFDRKLTSGEVIRMFQRHQDKGGSYSPDIVKPAFLAALVDGKFVGQLDEKAARSLLGMEEEEEGKDEAEAPASVPAAE